MLWRLGGKRSTFTLGAERPVRLPARRPPGCPTATSACSTTRAARRSNRPRAGEVVKLDLRPSTATLVQSARAQLRPTDHGSQGNIQSLPGGGWMVGWGGLPNFTEFDATGRSSTTPSSPRASSATAATACRGRDSRRNRRRSWRKRLSARSACARREPSARHRRRTWKSMQAGTVRRPCPSGRSSAARAPLT